MYFREQIAPLFELPFVEFIGEATEPEKETLLRGARALLFPIDWPEPFGLVMIESMSAGTPVIAWRNGSVPEVIKDGVSGIIVDSIAEAVVAAERSVTMDRYEVRRYFESRFTAARMASDYLDAFNRLLGSSGGRQSAAQWTQSRDALRPVQPGLQRGGAFG